MTLRDPVTKELGPHTIPVSKHSTTWILLRDIFLEFNEMPFSKLNSGTIFQRYPAEGSSRFLWVGSGSECRQLTGSACGSQVPRPHSAGKTGVALLE